MRHSSTPSPSLSVHLIFGSLLIVCRGNGRSPILSLLFLHSSIKILRSSILGRKVSGDRFSFRRNKLSLLRVFHNNRFKVKIWVAAATLFLCTILSLVRAGNSQREGGGFAMSGSPRMMGTVLIL